MDLSTKSIKFSNDLLLSDVLYVPKLDCNLMSNSKLTSDLNGISKFYLNLWEFLGWSQGRWWSSMVVKKHILQVDLIWKWLKVVLSIKSYDNKLNSNTHKTIWNTFQANINPIQSLSWGHWKVPCCWWNDDIRIC